MDISSVEIPFVDLHSLHQPLQAEFTQAIQTVLDRGDFILGQAVRDFEADFAAACGASYGVGVACGTDAIALGLQACGIGAGDEVILPANTFIATLMGVLQAEAIPVFADCDRDTALIDLEAAARAVTPRTKAILPVHLYGQMVSPAALRAFAETHNLLVFEDAAQAHLAQREGFHPGGVGAAAAFSFYPSKNLGAFGDGGILVTSDLNVVQRACTLRNYGAPQKYLHTEIGRNSRLDSLQAAILNVKLPHLKAWNQARNTAARQYDELLAPLRDRGIVPLQNHSGEGHVYHLYVVRVTAEAPCDRDTLQAAMRQQGVQTGIHYPLPCHLQPAYQTLSARKDEIPTYQAGDFPHAEALCQQGLSLPMYPGIRPDQIERVVAALSHSLPRSC